jgi:hypothetical protein
MGLKRLSELFLLLLSHISFPAAIVNIFFPLLLILGLQQLS